MPCAKLTVPTEWEAFFPGPLGEGDNNIYRFSIIGSNGPLVFFVTSNRATGERQLWSSDAFDPTLETELDSLVGDPSWWASGSIVAPPGQIGIVAGGGGSTYTATFYTNFGGVTGTLSVENEDEDVFPSGQMWAPAEGTMIGLSVVGQALETDPVTYDARLWVTLLDLKNQTLLGKWPTDIAFGLGQFGNDDTGPYDGGILLGANGRFYFRVAKSTFEPTIEPETAPGVYSFTLGESGPEDFQAEYLVPDEVGVAFSFMVFPNNTVIVAYNAATSGVVIAGGESPITVTIPDGFELPTGTGAPTVWALSHDGIAYDAGVEIVGSGEGENQQRYVLTVASTGAVIGMSAPFMAANQHLNGVFGITPRIQDPQGAYWRKIIKPTVARWT